MKKIITTFVLIAVAVLAFSANAHAQKSITIPMGADINSLIPGAYMRPMTKPEKSYLVASRTTGISSAVFAAGALGTGFGAIAYDIEARKLEGSDWNGYGAKDKEVSKQMLVTSLSLAGAAAALGVTSLCLKIPVWNKTIVKTETGGFVVEF